MIAGKKAIFLSFFSHASTPPDRHPLPTPPASVYPSPNNGRLLAIKQHFLKNPRLWSNGITVGWFRPLNSQQDFASHEENTASSNYPYYIDLPTAYDSGFTDYDSSKDGGRKRRWGRGRVDSNASKLCFSLQLWLAYLSATFVFSFPEFKFSSSWYKPQSDTHVCT